MSNIKDYLSGKRYINLDTVKYDCIYNKPVSSANLICNDKYEVSLSDENDIQITVTRYVKFEPDCFFSSEISYNVIHEILSEKKDDFKNMNFDLEKEVANDTDFFIPDEMDRVSLLISQLTDSFEGRPLITPPHLKL